jgi:hypothetical protein
VNVKIKKKNEKLHIKIQKLKELDPLLHEQRSNFSGTGKGMRKKRDFMTRRRNEEKKPPNPNGGFGG